MSLGSKIDMSQSFTLTGKINLGDKNGTKQGGDGIGFVFHPNNVNDIGDNGGALGIGGLKNAFGFKFDTWYNSDKTTTFNPDPSSFASNSSKVMGAFVTTDQNGKATTDADSVKFLPGPTNNTFNDVTIDYNGDTKTMTVSYVASGTTYTFTKNLSSLIQPNTNYALSMASSTGWAYNLQQFQISQFTYTAKGIVNVKYVDEKGNTIPGMSDEEKSGAINEKINFSDAIAKAQKNGYQLVSSSSTVPSAFDSASNSATVTTKNQTVTYVFKDISAPTISSIGNQTKEVNTAITPVTISTSDNSGGTVTNSVSGLPKGVTFDSSTNTISGTPSTVGNYNVTVKSTDATGNSATTTFTITVRDTIAPVVTSIGNQTKEVNTAITPITISTSDNSKDKVTNVVDGLPVGVTFDSSTNTISGTPTNVGTSTVTVTSTDPSGNATKTTFTITVTDNTAPTVEAIPSQTKEVNTPIDTITIKGKDNSGKAVTNEVSGLPKGVTFDSATNTISGSPSEIGTSQVTVTTKDPSGNTTKTTFTITVTDSTAPTVETIPSQTKEVNTPIDTITIKGKDNSGKPVTNEVSGLPKGVTFDPSTNTISGTPTNVGTSTVTVTTKDPSGNTTKTIFTITVKDTIAPVVTSIGNQTKEVNTAITPITISTSDNSKGKVTNVVDGLPEGVTFDSSTNTISGTPTNVGTSTVTVTSTDPSGNATKTTFTITVQDNTAPTVEAIPSQTKEVNTPIDTITIKGKDNSGKAVTNEVSGLPKGVTFDPSTNTISGSPSEVGTSQVTVMTKDPSGNTTKTTFTITVTDNTAPTVEAIGNQTKEVNTPIDTITIKGQDNSGKSVKNEVNGLPKGVTFDPETNTISGTPSEVGEYPITVTTTDAEGNHTETTFTIIVKDETAPTVEAIGDQTKEVNTPIDTITIKGEDNSGKPVKNEVSGLPKGVTFDPSTNTISGTPSEVGTNKVTVITTDAHGNHTETTFTITVKDETAPTVEAIDDQTKEVNTPIDTITIKGEDNSGKPVTNEVSGLPKGVTFDPETNTISGTPSEVGTNKVTVITTDANGNHTETTFTITVTDKTAPTVEAIGDQTKEVNTPIDPITIKGEDNSGKPVTNEVKGLPDGVTFDSSTNTISGNPSEVGEYPITVTTTDEQGNHTETTFTITVVDKTAPTVEAIGDQTKEVNTPIDSITIKAEDNSGKPVTNEVSGLPEGVTFDPSTNTISGTPSEVGKYPVTVTTTDVNGNHTETTFTIIVKDETAPTVEAIDSQTKEVNTPIDTITIKGQDNSGKPVTNEVSGLPKGVTFDPSTNTISGNPSEVGEYPVTVTTTDAEGNHTETTFTITVVDKTAPTVEAIGDQTKEVNTPINTITIKGQDNSGKAVTNEVKGLPEGVTFDPTTNTISGSPSEVGEYPVTVTTTDAVGNHTETTFTISVVDKTAPTVEPIGDQTKEVNTPVDTITIKGEDNSGKPVTNEVSGLPKGVTFDPETNTISGTPSEVGTSEVTVTTKDSSGNTTKTTFTITVKDETAPTVEAIDNQTKEVNTPIDTITIKAEDNSGKPVTNEVKGLPKGVTFDPTTNTISGSPSEVGEYPITVTTTDAVGNHTETTFTITVVDKTAPTVEPIGEQTKEVNTPIDSITIKAEDNSGKPVKNEVKGLPDGVTFDPETNTISGSPSEVGEYPITVTTTDEQGNHTETTFTIIVKDETAPTVEAIGSQTKEVNTPIDTITIKGQDNSGKPVTNEVSGLPKGVTFDPSTNTISGTPSEVGTNKVTVITTDANGNHTETTFTITVTDKTAPTVEAIDDQTKEVNTPIDPITIKGEDNSGKPVTNEVSGLPKGVTFDPETNTISGNPSEVGEYPITVTTIDAVGNHTETTFTITVVDKTAPTVEAIGSQTKEVNTPIDSITIKGEDNSGKPVTNEVSGLPKGVTFDPETNTISGTPSEVGTNKVTVITTDANGNHTETTFTITVTDKTAPTVEAIDDQTKEVNTPIDPITIKGEDNSGKPVTNEVSGLPKGVTFDPETNTISGSPSEVGEYPITVTTIDAVGNHTETTFTITVVDKTAPTVEAIDDQTKEVNTPIDNITIKGEDNSGKPVTNEVSGLPKGVTFDPSTNTISGSPSEVGTSEVTVTSKDSSGNTTKTTFTITVTDNTAPTVEAIGNQTKEVNTPIDTITIKGEDNSGKPVTNEVKGLPDGVTFDPETNTISGTPSEVGEYPITVTTTDVNGNYTETTFTITVTDKTAPTVEAIGNQTKEVNTPIDTITIKGEDNSGKSVTNKVEGLPDGVTFNPSTNTISGTPSEVGTYPITVTTTDAEGNHTETTFTITVIDKTSPTVEAIGNQTKEVNTPIDTITIKGQDNSGKPVTNEVSGLPKGVTFDPSTNTISGTPSEVGEYPITVTTTDANGNHTETTFTITVVDKTAPTVEAIGDQTKEVNTPINPITIKGEDNSGKPVKNEVKGLPDGVTFDPETNTISGTPSEVGTYPITVVTTDANGNQTETTFTITVIDKTVPTVEPIGDQTKEVNTPIDPIIIKGEDNSGKPVKNEVKGLPKGVTFDPETNTISGTPSEVGTYPITVITTDANGNQTETTFIITVTPKDSGEPSTPSNPGEPSTPSNPGEPSTPSNPGEPSTPSNPGEPSTPSNPGEPSTPSNPGEPSTPSNPGEPSTPSNPGEPSTPSNPGEPSTPSNPGEPSTPSNPGESSTPSNPGEPSTPSNPGEPSTPNNPGEPSAPSETVAPENNVQDTSGIGSTDNSTQDNAATKDKKENNQHSLPETGGDKSSNTTLIGGILAAIVGIFLLGRRRKKQ